MWPAGECVAGSLSMRIQQLDVRCETKTKDNVFVNVVVSVQYRKFAWSDVMITVSACAAMTKHDLWT